MKGYDLDTRKLDKIIAGNEKKADAFLRYEATLIVNDIKLAINEISHGETVVRYDPRRSVVVSREGDAPNADMGALINSIMFTPVGKLEYWVHDGVVYGLALEETYNRPFVQPAFEARRKALAEDAKKFGLLMP